MKCNVKLNCHHRNSFVLNTQLLRDIKTIAIFFNLKIKYGAFLLSKLYFIFLQFISFQYLKFL